MNRISNQFKRDLKASLITLILYIPLLFWWQQSSLKVATPTTPTPLVLNIQDFHTKEEIIKKEPILEEHIIEEEFFEDLEEIMKEPIVPEPIPQPLSKKPKPIVEKKIIKKKIVKKKIVKKKVKKRKITKKREIKKRKYIKSSKKASSKKSNLKFLSKLKRSINKNKIYPRMAKKRGIQGSVKVSFTITTSGRVTNIRVNGSKAFTKATKKAIERSFPIDTKGVSLPITLNLTLNYRLKRGV